jgi:hypothetical protein
MDAVTFTDSAVQEAMANEFVPVRLAHDDAAMTERFQIKSTPTMLIFGPDGEETHRMVGFLPVAAFLAGLCLSQAKLAKSAGDADAALALLDSLLTAWPKEEVAAEALFLRGRTLFETTKDTAHLKAMAEELAVRFPMSAFTAQTAKYKLV